MPRLTPAFSDAVFFLYEKNQDPNTPADSLVGPVGTGVLVGDMDITAPGLFHTYAVTAAHVALTGGSIIAVNTYEGVRRFIEFDPAEWVADLDREDIAAVDITDRLVFGRLGGDQVRQIPYSMFADDKFFREFEFGIGEDGFMLGLFSEVPGFAQNAVAARFGNVSLLADAGSPISRYDPGLDRTFLSPCHAFDMHSRPGTSGSPVFVYRTTEGDLRDLEMRATVKRVTISGHRNDPHSDYVNNPYGHDYADEVEIVEHDYRKNRFLKLFGIHVAQFHDEVEITKVGAANEKCESAELRDGDAIRFPGSMSMVVPAFEILHLLEHPTLKQQRQERRRTFIKKQRQDPKRGAIVQEKKAATQAVPESDNPDHKEDFTRLLNAAGRTPPQGD